MCLCIVITSCQHNKVVEVLSLWSSTRDIDYHNSGTSLTDEHDRLATMVSFVTTMDSIVRGFNHSLQGKGLQSLVASHIHLVTSNQGLHRKCMHMQPSCFKVI